MKTVRFLTLYYLYTTIYTLVLVLYRILSYKMPKMQARSIVFQRVGGGGQETHPKYLDKQKVKSKLKNDTLLNGVNDERTQSANEKEK